MVRDLRCCSGQRPGEINVKRSKGYILKKSCLNAISGLRAALFDESIRSGVSGKREDCEINCQHRLPKCISSKCFTKRCLTRKIELDLNKGIFRVQRRQHDAECHRRFSSKSCILLNLPLRLLSSSYVGLSRNVEFFFSRSSTQTLKFVHPF